MLTLFIDENVDQYELPKSKKKQPVYSCLLVKTLVLSLRSQLTDPKQLD
jgi:hypothetical protein